MEENSNVNTQKDPPTDKDQLSKAKQRILTVTITSLMFLSLCADTMIFPFFPDVATEKGLSNAEIGIVFSSFDFAKFIASPIFGSLLVKWPPKSMCASGNILTALACIGFGLSKFVTNKNAMLALCLLVRIPAGIGSAMLTVSAMSILLKCTSYKPSTIAAIGEVVIGLGYTAGPALGAVLMELVGYTGMFCVLGGVMLAFISVYMFVVPKVEENEKRERKGFMSLLAIPGCLLIFAHCVNVRLNASARDAEISEYMISSFGVSSSVVGVSYGLWSAVYILMSPVGAKIVNKKNPFYLIFAGWCLMAVLLLLIPPSPLLDFIFHQKKYFWLTSGAFTAAFMIQPLAYVPILPGVLSLTEVCGFEKDNLHVYGMVNGLINSGLALGNTAGPIIGGLLTDSLGFPWAFTVFDSTNILMAVLIGSFLVYMKCTHQPLYVPEDSNEEGTKEENKVVAVENQINEACTHRMNECLKSNRSMTVPQEQQPLLESSH